MGHWVSKLCVELIDKTLDEPVTVDGIIHNLLHGSTDREEVLILFILKQHINNVTEPKNKENREKSKYYQPEMGGVSGVLSQH